MNKTLIIFGSARNDGNTMVAVQHCFGEYLDSAAHDVTMIDLADQHIDHYNYDDDTEDDFISIAEQMAASDTIVFASPVYWYSVSGRLKTFFDRFTDLITTRKDLGRLLSGKSAYVIACGSEAEMPQEFQKPIEATCQYFEIAYKGAFYYSVGKKSTRSDEEQIAAAKAFSSSIIKE
jgi:multimeric flavodoxin WrbA